MAREDRGSREDQRELTLVVEGTDTGLWDRKAGGGTKTDSAKYRRGAMGDSFSLGGHSAIEDITLTRDFDLNRDLPLLDFLEKWAGSGDIVLSEQFLDRTKLPKGKAVTYLGTLKDVDPPDANSSVTDVALIQVVLEITTKNSGQN